MLLVVQEDALSAQLPHSKRRLLNQKNIFEELSLFIDWYNRIDQIVFVIIYFEFNSCLERLYLFYVDYDAENNFNQTESYYTYYYFQIKSDIGQQFHTNMNI